MSNIYNNKLRVTHIYTQKEVKNDKIINMEGVSKNVSDFRMCLNLNNYIKLK